MSMDLEEHLKIRFKAHMIRFYPLGMMQDQQIRDLICTFVMGWFEATQQSKNMNQIRATDQFMDVFLDRIVGMPVEDWKWWDDGSKN